MNQFDLANNPEEVVDLVDASDVVIGTISRKEVNKRSDLIHREISILIYNSANQILFQQRSKHKDTNPGMWSSSCSGHIPAGMKPAKAAAKELQEELGLWLPLHFMKKVLTHLPHETYFKYWYSAKYTDEIITINELEVEKIAFLDVESVRQYQAEGEVFFDKFLDTATEFWQNKLSGVKS